MFGCLHLCTETFYLNDFFPVRTIEGLPNFFTLNFLPKTKNFAICATGNHRTTYYSAINVCTIFLITREAKGSNNHASINPFESAVDYWCEIFTS